MAHRKLSLVLIALLALSISLPSQAEGKKMGEFTVKTELPRLPVLAQGNTGTCWCFATTSFLETELQRIHGRPVDLSEMYTVRHTVMAKAKNYVNKKGKAPFGQGGLSHDVIAMIREHGIVPQSAYTGLTPGKARHSHGKMFKAVKGIIQPASEGAPLPADWTDAVTKVIDSGLGKAPESFEVDGKQLTPKQYATDVLKIPLNDYVEVMSYSYAPFHQRAKLTVTDNWMEDDRYLNVPLKEFMQIFDNALATGYSVAVDIDVSERTYRPNQGLGTLTEELEKPQAITQAVRDEMFKSKKTSDDHLLHIVGVAHKDGKKYYITKDSWGPGSGTLNGYRMLTENYIRAKVLAFMIHKNAIPVAR